MFEHPRLDWKHKPQPMSCSHALSTKKKERVPGQQKVPLGNTLHGTATDIRLKKKKKKKKKTLEL